MKTLSIHWQDSVFYEANVDWLKIKTTKVNILGSPLVRVKQVEQQLLPIWSFLNFISPEKVKNWLLAIIN